MVRSRFITEESGLQCRLLRPYSVWSATPLDPQDFRKNSVRIDGWLRLPGSVAERPVHQLIAPGKTSSAIIHTRQGFYGKEEG